MAGSFNRSLRPNPSIDYGKPSTNKGFAPTAYIGIVKDNSDVSRMGRIRVWIPDMGGTGDDENSWYTVDYVSPFAGASDPSNLRKDGVQEEDTQFSYGMWWTPPEINNQVLVFFAGGKTNRGVYIGSFFGQNMNSQIPGTPSVTTFQDKFPNEVPKPGSEYPRRNLDNNPDNTDRPINTKLTNGLARQGTWTDTARGVSDSSSRRESPSLINGFRTKTGWQFLFDENPNHEYWRVRSPSGAQIMIDETYGFIYLISKDGNNWVEMQNDGQIDVYSKLSVNIHSEQDFNIRADRDVNIESGRNINLKTVGETAPGDFNIEVARDMNTFVKNNIRERANQNIHRHAGNTIYDEATSTYFEKAGDQIARSASQIHHNSFEVPSAEQAQSIPINQHPDNRKVTQSIDSRVPEHEPWVTHNIFEPGRHLSEIPMRSGGVNAPLSGTSPAQFNNVRPQNNPPPSNPRPPIQNNSCFCGQLENINSLSLSEDGLIWIIGATTYTPYAKNVTGGANENLEWQIGYTLTNETTARGFVQGVTEEEAFVFASQQFIQAERTVKSSGINVPISQELYDALVSLVSETGNLDNGLVTSINQENCQQAESVWLGLNQGGQDRARRQREVDLAFRCSYGTIPSRCDLKKEGEITAMREYPIIASDDDQKRQIEFALYKMGNDIYNRENNLRKEVVGVNLRFETEVKQTIGRTVPDDYPNPCQEGINPEGICVDWKFIERMEGTRQEGYVPMDKNGNVFGKSGVTIASGFDIGQRSVNGLQKLNFNNTLFNKLQPYCLLKREQAVEQLNQIPLFCTENEVLEINQRVKARSLKLLMNKFDKETNGIKFMQMPCNAQTALASFAFQWGFAFGDRKHPVLWNHFLNADYSSAAQYMRAQQRYSYRRGEEAKLLEDIT